MKSLEILQLNLFQQHKPSVGFSGSFDVDCFNLVQGIDD